jgi:hypothetical protein
MGILTGKTERAINTAPYLVAANRLLVVSRALFNLAMKARNGSFDETANESYEHWFVLRETVQKFLDTRDVVLSPVARARMVAALKFAHSVSHDCDVVPGTDVPTVDACTCPTSERIKEVTAQVFGAVEFNAAVAVRLAAESCNRVA